MFLNVSTSRNLKEPKGTLRNEHDMIMELPKPQPDQKAYSEMLQRGFKRFPQRAENYRKYQEGKRGVIVAYLPVKMDYEVVSRCNFRCIMCRINDWKGGKRAADMPFEDYRRSLEDLFSLVEIKLQGVGEPLLHPRIFDMIREAAQRDIWTRVNVNGSLLKVRDNYKRLIDADPGEIQVSVDAATKKTFESIRRGAHFEQIVENATLLNEYADARGVLKTRSWTVIQKSNIDELADIVRLGSRMKFKRMTFSIALSFWGLDNWEQTNKEIDVGADTVKERAEALIQLGSRLGVEVTFWDGSSKYALKGEKKDLCAWIFERAFLSSDMRLVPCCVLADPAIADFGDARDFVKLWNSPGYQSFRALHLEGKIPEFCKQCYD